MDELLVTTALEFDFTILVFFIFPKIRPFHCKLNLPCGIRLKIDCCTFWVLGELCQAITQLKSLVGSGPYINPKKSKFYYKPIPCHLPLPFREVKTISLPYCLAGRSRPPLCTPVGVK